ncbi:MAG: hypothetical protein NUV97_02690 [archaeon]|nr:hypothetical protein [archaeon]
MKNKEIVIEVYGGCVTSVYSTWDNTLNTDVIIIDHDNRDDYPPAISEHDLETQYNRLY